MLSIKSEPRLPGWAIAGQQTRNLFVPKGFVSAPDARKYNETKLPTNVPLYENKKFSTWQNDLARCIHQGSHAIVDVTTSCGKTWATNLIIAHEVYASTATAIIVSPNIEVMRECVHDIGVNYEKRYKYPSCKMLDSTSRNYATYNEKRFPIAQIIAISVENFIDFITNRINEDFMKKLRYIVFDEVHLPAISEGLWWAQFVPQQAQLILLSATIGNCTYLVELLDKMCQLVPGRPRKIETIKWDVRPVPLQYVLFKGIPALKFQKKNVTNQSLIPDSSDDEENETSKENVLDLDGFAPKAYVRAGKLDLIVNPRAPTMRDIKSLDPTLTVIPVTREEQHKLGKTVIPFKIDLIRTKLKTALATATVDPTPENMYHLLSYLFSNGMQPVMVFHSTTSSAQQLCEKMVGYIETLERNDPAWNSSMKQSKQFETEQSKKRERQDMDKKKKNRNSDDEVTGKADDWTHALEEHTSRIDINTVQKVLNKWKFPANVTDIPANMPNWVKIALEYGIGVYTSFLPLWLRHYMFDAFKTGQIKVLVADRGISVGINLPIRSVIVCGEDLTPTLFNQVAGRAGRQGYEEQGYVIPMFAKDKIEAIIMSDEKILNVAVPEGMTYSDVIRLNVPQNLDNFYTDDVFHTEQVKISPYKAEINSNYIRYLDTPEKRKEYASKTEVVTSEKWHYHRLTNLIKILPGNLNLLVIRILITGALHDLTVTEFLDFMSIVFNRHEGDFLPVFQNPDIWKMLDGCSIKYGLGIDFSKPIDPYFRNFCKDASKNIPESGAKMDDIMAMGDWLYNLKNEVAKIAPSNDKFRQLLDKVDTQFLIARKRT